MGKGGESSLLYGGGRAFSQRVLGLSESSISLISSRARELRSAGRDVIDLSAGVPDFDTPDEIKGAAFEALRAGHTRYAPPAGVPLLCERVVSKLKEENGLHYAQGEIVISHGVRQAVINACLALLGPGDEAIVISPFWVSYPDFIRFAGARPVVVPTRAEDGFRPDLSVLSAAINDSTKLILLNSPSNPSGVVYTSEELRGIVAICRENPNIWILSDEIYESIIFEGKHVSPASCPGGRERTIVLNGFSKSFAMTGWRIGYTAAPKPVAKCLSRVQALLTGGVSPFIQYASSFALKMVSPKARCASYLRRRDRIIALLRKIPDVTVHTPAGAFYVFPNIGAYLGRSYKGKVLRSADDLVSYLLEEASVAVVSGVGFGDPHCIRLTFAVSDEDIEKGIERISYSLSNLS